MSFENFGYSWFDDETNEQIDINYWITPKHYCYQQMAINGVARKSKRISEGAYVSGWEYLNNY